MIIIELYIMLSSSQELQVCNNHLQLPQRNIWIKLFLACQKRYVHPWIMCTLKSDGVVGLLIFGIGTIFDIFRASGNWFNLRNELNKSRSFKRPISSFIIIEIILGEIPWISQLGYVWYVLRVPYPQLNSCLIFTKVAGESEKSFVGSNFE